MKEFVVAFSGKFQSLNYNYSILFNLVIIITYFLEVCKSSQFLDH